MKLVFISVFLFLNTVFADTVTCSLKSGGWVRSATLNLEKQQGKYVTSRSVYDLSFNMTTECQQKTCSTHITVDSGILEDEAGSTGFEFQRSGKSREIFREPIEGAPDKRQYEIYCRYRATKS